jgi:Tfp pilus assembly protein PilE
MAEFAEGLDLDLEHAKRAMAEQAREMEAYFEDSMTQAGQLRAKMQGTMVAFSNYFQVSPFGSFDAQILT